MQIFSRPLWITLLLLLPLLLWDASGLDVPTARFFGSAQGFAWSQNPLFVLLLHQLPRIVGWLFLLTLAWGTARPWGFLHALSVSDRWQLLLSIILALLVVVALKRLSTTSCPWDLVEFGGAAHYISHWHWGLADGGPGHCFPAGHASAGFAFVSGGFVLQRTLPQLARRWVLAALLAGFVLGWAQQIRGAHYFSHTLWTAWICWTIGWAVEAFNELIHHKRCTNASLNANKSILRTILEKVKISARNTCAK